MGPAVGSRVIPMKTTTVLLASLLAMGAILVAPAASASSVECYGDASTAKVCYGKHVPGYFLGVWVAGITVVDTWID